MARRWYALVLAVVLILTPVPALASTGGGTNPVVLWNSNAQQAIYEVARQAPYVAPRSFAMVHGAIYDAVNAIAGTPYEPYLSAPPARRGDSLDAAVASAAYRVLLSLFPSQSASLDQMYADALAVVPAGGAKTRGIRVGERAAAAMIAARAGDGAFANVSWNTSTAPGQWRPTPPTLGSDGAWVGDLKPFVLPRGDMFRTSGPTPLTSAAWARDFNEVKAIGAVNSTVRTADQTEAAIWWHDRRLTEWEIKRQVSDRQHLSTVQAARFFAMAEIANADSLIACFNEKKFWNFWRPVTAVQEAASDGNPRTSADPSWMPLLVTPPFPDYTSGHTCSTSTIMATMRAYFGRDDIPFSAYSADSGTTRSFRSFSAALDEVVEARIWGGVHYRTADVQGVRIGNGVASYVLRHEFRRR
ncbi:phosphatase PAP2 family protein [Actinoplanes bogorensis]|uniref:Phosphatase PAP2 family protein n=1 Tax=Paractinoplanes bogorensis TaxID=1610840 RepID=A0ABS5YNX1_9ACTN|nr:vanadium-dependent haloperoxidase [Actinoplanes bogorensis]MBU2665154.1 phosphatase PAP2 family protein [Actinoplanes bogorensis]